MRKSFLRKVIGSLLFTYAIGYGIYSYINQQEQHRADPKYNLSEKEQKQDLDLLIYTLENGYAGKILLGDIYSQSVSELKKLRTDIHSTIRTEDFYYRISEIINKIPDGHLLIKMDIGSLQVSRTLASIPEEQQNCTDPRIKEFTHQNKKIVQLSLPTFMIEGRDTESILIDSLKNQLPNADALIIDLRGNSGGYQNLAMKIAATLWGTEYREDHAIQYFPMPLKTWHALYNKVAIGLIANLLIQYDSDAGRNLKKNLAILPDLKINPSNDPDFSATSYEDLNVYEDEEIDIEKRGFPHPIYLIVDKYCASACERFMEALEYHPYSKTIGQKTAGATQFGSVGLLTLKYSKLQVFVPSSYVTYKDQRKTERIGYAPTYPIPENEDSIQFALSKVAETK